MSNENNFQGPKNPINIDENEDIKESKKIEFSKEAFKENIGLLKEALKPFLEKLDPLKEKLKPLAEKAGVAIDKAKEKSKNLDFKTFLIELKNFDYKGLAISIYEEIDKLITVDRKKLKLIVIITALLAFFVMDIFWIITPNKKETIEDEIRPDYTMEEVAGAMEKYKNVLIENPNDYKAFIEIGKLYRVLDEKEKAKVAFFQAIERSPENNYDAMFELAGLYICDEQPDFANEVLNQIKDKNLSKSILFKKARYVSRVANLYYLEDYLHKSYDSYTKAIDYLKELEQEEYLKKINTEKRNMLIDLSDYVYYEEHNLNQALAYLDESQKIEENPWAFARKGYLFFEQPKVAAEYFERAFNHNPATINHEVFINVLFDAIKIAKEEQRTSDKDYYKYVLGKVRANSHKSLVYKNLLVTNMEAYIEKVDNSTLYTPVVYFQVSNSSEQKPRDYVKIRAVFYKDNNKIVGHRDEVVVKPVRPLWMGTSTDIIRLNSNRPITQEEKDNSVYKVVVYISKDRPDQWKLAGSTFVKRH